MTNNLPILSKADWGKCYPETEYSTNSARVKAHLIHFLLGLDQPTQFVISQIQRIAEKAKSSQDLSQLSKLSDSDKNNYNFTPLHISVIQGKLDVVVALLAVKSVRDTIDSRDVSGWTAFHHAAIPSENSGNIAKKLEDFGADTRLLTPFRGSFADIRNLVTLKNEPPAWIRSVQYEGAALTKEKIAQVFGDIQLRDHHYYAPEQRKALWIQKSEEEHEAFQVLLLGNSLKLAPKKFNITKVSHQGQELANFYGLAAGENLPAGSFVGIYVGRYKNDPNLHCFLDRFLPEELTNGAYKLGEYNADTVRNHVPMINYGFPNIVPITGQANGIANAALYFAGEQINSGMPLYYDYGPEHQVNYGPQILFNRDQMREFFKLGFDQLHAQSNRYSQEYSRIESLPLKTREKMSFVTTPSDLQMLLLKTKVLFPLGNPIAMLDLHFSGTLNIQEWKQFANWGPVPNTKGFGPMIERWCAVFPIHFFNQIRLINWLSALDEEIKTKKPGDYPFFQQWVLDRLENSNLMDLTKGIEWIGAELLKEPRENTNEEISKSIALKMKAYDWTRDPMNLYGTQSRYNSYHEYYNLKTQAVIDRTPIEQRSKDPNYFNRIKLNVIDVSTENADPEAAEDESMHLIQAVRKSVEEEMVQTVLKSLTTQESTSSE